jgi:hypothetical protein
VGGVMEPQPGDGCPARYLSWGTVPRPAADRAGPVTTRELAPLAMRMMEGSASPSEQQDYGRRLIAARQRLWQRASETVEVVIDGEVLESKPLTLSEPCGCRILGHCAELG